jgi:hypothetical protein
VKGPPFNPGTTKQQRRQVTKNYNKEHEQKELDMNFYSVTYYDFEQIILIL